MQDTQGRVAAIFSAANWTAGEKDGWNGSYIWSDGSVIGGIDPWGTPRVTVVGVRSPTEAAAWLVQHAIDLRLAPAAEPEQTPAHEAHEETGATLKPPVVSEAEAQAIAETQSLFDEGGEASEDHGDPRFESGLAPEIMEPDAPEVGGAAGEIPVAAFPDPLDADFSEPLPELGQELSEEHPEEYAASVAIFGDNLDQKRTAAIGLVMRYARSLMPFWTSDSDIALIELRNYAMGAAEGRWAQDEHRARELQEMEATLSRMNAIAAARDAKVEFLESATREEVEAFDPEANWP